MIEIILWGALVLGIVGAKSVGFWFSEVVPCFFGIIWDITVAMPWYFVYAMYCGMTGRPTPEIAGKYFLHPVAGKGPAVVVKQTVINQVSEKPHETKKTSVDEVNWEF